MLSWFMAFPTVTVSGEIEVQASPADPHVFTVL